MKQTNDIDVTNAELTDWSIFANFTTKNPLTSKDHVYNHAKFQGVFHSLVYLTVISKNTLDEMLDVLDTFLAISYRDANDVVYLVMHTIFELDDVDGYPDFYDPSNTINIYKATSNIISALYDRKWFNPETCMIPYIKESYIDDIDFDAVSDDEFFARRDYMEAISEFIKNIKNEKYKRRSINVLNDEYRKQQTRAMCTLHGNNLEPDLFGSIMGSIVNYCGSDYSVELNRGFIREIQDVLSNKKKDRAGNFELIEEIFPEAYVNFQYSRIVMNILEYYVGEEDVEKFKLIMNEIQPNSQIEINTPHDIEESIIYILKVIGVLMLISKAYDNPRERKFLETYDIRVPVTISTSVAQKYAAKGYLIKHKVNCNEIREIRNF